MTAKRHGFPENMTLDQRLEVLRWKKKYEKLQKSLRKVIFDKDDAYEDRVMKILRRIADTRLLTCECCGAMV